MANDDKYALLYDVNHGIKPTRSELIQNRFLVSNTGYLLRLTVIRHQQAVIIIIKSLTIIHHHYPAVYQPCNWQTYVWFIAIHGIMIAGL